MVSTSVGNKHKNMNRDGSFGCLHPQEISDTHRFLVPMRVFVIL